MNNKKICDDTDDSQSGKDNMKRRSLVFRRRSLGPTANEDVLGSVDETQEAKKIKTGNEENNCQSFDLQKYIDSLKKEAKEWREEYLKRKTRVYDITKRVKNLENNKLPLDLSILTETERKFLADKPDYEEFNNNLIKLNAAATKIAYLNLCAENHCEKIVSKLQKEIDKTSKRIMKISD